MAIRLPVYILLDNSLQTDMRAVQKIEELLTALLKAMDDDPFLLETAYVSVLKLGGVPKVILPFADAIEMSDFRIPPYYRLEGTRNVGAGFALLVKRIKKEVNMPTGRNSTTGKIIHYPAGGSKKDFNPRVALLVGGNPDDDINKAVMALRTIGIVEITVCCCSRNCDHGIYEELSSDVYDMTGTSREQISSFCKRFGYWPDISVRCDEP